MRSAIFIAFGALALGALAGCKEEAARTETAAQGQGEAATLSAAIGEAAGMTTLAAALKGTGLNTVFDGAAPYTLLAPEDDAFGKLGETAKMLSAPENGAAMAAVLRAHVLPGYVTVADIDAAQNRAKGKPVKMTTMAGGEVSFARDNGTLVVTAADGASAKISGKELTTGNGVAIPVDTVLKQTPPHLEGIS